MKNKSYIRFAVFIVAMVLLVVAIFSLSDDILSPYVTFKEAKKKPGKYVQIIGVLDKKVKIKHTERDYTFTIIDKNKDKMIVVHDQAKPINLEHAEQIVVLGSFNSTNIIFVAKKVLVKCPSKYTKKVKK
ncbi:cytochrome c maturation protein CcmE [Spirochaetota bacterium]